MHCYTQWGGQKCSDVSAFMDALQAKPEFETRRQDDMCLRIIANLSDDEVELAANTSYAFWFVTKQMGLCLHESVKINMARKEAKRHLVANSWVYDKAFQSTREALQLRKKYQVDRLRACFGQSSFPTIPSSESEEEICQLQASVGQYLQNQPSTVQQNFKESRAVLFHCDNSASDCNDEEDKSYLMAQLYMVERGLAVREFASSGEDEAIVPILDFQGLVSSSTAGNNFHVSAISSTKKLQQNSQLLQRIYPGRFKTVTCSNAPFYVSSLHDMASSSEIIQRGMRRNKIDRMTFVGTENFKLGTPFNIERYLWKIPFHLPYDTVQKCADEDEEMNVDSTKEVEYLHGEECRLLRASLFQHWVWSQALMYLLLTEILMYFVQQIYPLYSTLCQQVSLCFANLAPISEGSSPNEAQPIVSKTSIQRQLSGGPALCIMPVVQRASCQAGAWIQRHGSQIDAPV